MNKKNGDWAPRKKENLLAMAKQWEAVLDDKGKSWDIQPADYNELSGLTAVSEKALEKAVSCDCTSTDRALCAESFAALLKYMRSLKRRKFLSPPLIDSDYISLGLKPGSNYRKPVEVPTGFVTAEVVYPGAPHRVGLRVMRISASDDPRADYGWRIYWGVLPHGGGTLEEAAGSRRYLMKVPLNGSELPYSVFTRRKNKYFDFEGEDAGKTVYFCIRYENSKGKAGPWGPMVSAIIP